MKLEEKHSLLKTIERCRFTLYEELGNCLARCELKPESSMELDSDRYGEFLDLSDKVQSHLHNLSTIEKIVRERRDFNPCIDRANAIATPAVHTRDLTD